MEQCRGNSDSEIGGTVKQCLWNSVVEQWNSGTVMVEQCWWNSVMEQWNSVGGTVEQCWWNSLMEQWNRGIVEQ